MKTILFDLYNSQPFKQSKYHGGGEYIKTIFKYLVDNKLDQINLVTFFDKDKFLDEYILKLIEDNNIKCFYIKELQEIKNIFPKIHIDILYSGIPYYYKKEWFPKNLVFKGTIHGLRYLEKPTDQYAPLYFVGMESLKERVKLIFKEQFRRKKYNEFKNLITIIDEMIIVSNHSYFSLVSFFPEVLKKKNYVLYTPSKQYNYCEQSETDYDFPYILLMGGNRWEKNCYREIMAIENLFKKGLIKDYKVVVIGRVTNKITKKIRDLDKYIFKDYVGSNELEKLFKFTELFMYCSLNEGFGMPPLEAMKYGKTCIVSGVCSLPEVCGNAVYYVNPYDINEISGRILNALRYKINIKEVVKRVEDIRRKQDEDLEKTCEVIIK